MVPVVFISEVKPLAVYTVENEQLKLKSGKLEVQDEEKAFRLFEKFKKLIPYEWRKNIIQYNVEKDYYFGAYISYSEEDKNKMALGINVNIDYLNSGLTMIHEFAHLFSMDET